MTKSSVVDQLRQLPDLRERLQTLSDYELEALLYDWESWARPGQLAPDVAQNGLPWATWLILAGRGFGKTRVGAEQVRKWKRQGFKRVNFIAPTSDDLRDVMIEGESGILAVCPRNERPVYRVSKRRLEWPDGSISLLFSAEEPERLRGKQHDKLWCDEPAAWRYDQECWDQAMFGLRLGKEPQTVATTTPRPTKLIRGLLADPTTAVTRGTTYDNKANLAPTFYTKIIKKYEGTRLGRQELMAEVLDDNPGALFKLAFIEATRVSSAPDLVRIVVAIDPATTSNADSDETGIVVVGMDDRDPAHFYVLEDASEVYTPDGWASKAVTLYHHHQADRVVGEANNGGDMIETVIRHQENASNVSYKKVTATRGKTIRAEPVAALYEQRRVHHVGTLSRLEDQMINWNPQTDTDSPDRMDANVWALTELAGGWESWAGLLRHYQNVGAEAAKPKAQGADPDPKPEGIRPAPTPPTAELTPALKQYNAVMAKMTPVELCSRCNQPLGSDSMTDGYTSWHPGCNNRHW